MNTIKQSAIDIYKEILLKKIKSFPQGFWKSEQGKQNGITITKYLIEDILQLPKNKVITLTKQTFIDYKLSSMINYVFDKSYYNAINAVYPNEFKRWEFTAVPKNYWTNEHIKEAVKWLIIDKLKYNDNDIKNKLNKDDFQNNGLGGLYCTKFHNSYYEVINFVYPNKFKKSDFKNYIYFNSSHTQWTKSIIKEKFETFLIQSNLSKKDIKTKVSTKDLPKDLFNLIYNKYHNSLFKLIDYIYPNEFKRWEFRRVPKGYWTDEHIKESVKWLIENKLKYNDNDIKNKLNRNDFINNGLGSLLRNKFNNSVYNILNFVYPNKFQRQELKRYNKKETH